MQYPSFSIVASFGQKEMIFSIINKSRFAALVFLCIVGVASIVCIGCSGGNVAGGVEDGNVVGGIVCDSSGAPVKGVLVRVGPSEKFWNDTTTIYADTTDSAGRFSVLVHGSEVQSVLCDATDGRRGLNASVLSGDTTASIKINVTGSLKVTVPLSKHVRELVICGTDLSTNIPADSGSVQIDNVPAGTIGRLLIVDNGSISTVVDSATISSGVVTYVGRPKVLLVYGAFAPPSLLAFFDSAGIDYTLRADSTFSASDTVGVNAIFLADGTEFGNSQLLLAVAEFTTKTVVVSCLSMWQTFGMVASSATITTIGTTTNNTMTRREGAAGIFADSLFTNDSIVLTNSGTLLWGRPAPAASRWLSVSADTSMVTAFEYDSGAVMANGTANGRRVGLFFSSDVVLSSGSNPIALVKALLRRAAGYK